MGASLLKPLTVKEVEKLTAMPPGTTKYLYLGGVPGFVMVHTPVGSTGYGLVNRRGGGKEETYPRYAKSLSLGDARKLAGQYRAGIEGGNDPTGEKNDRPRSVLLR
jgi:hypothetical protein